jgi:hypothetical protein
MDLYCSPFSPKGMSSSSSSFDMMTAGHHGTTKNKVMACVSLFVLAPYTCKTFGVVIIQLVFRYDCEIIQRMGGVEIQQA